MRKSLNTLVLLATFAVACSGVSHADEPNDIRVMSFNIRYGTASDGDNHWKHRHGLVTETVRRFDPDLLGTQEVMKFQAEYLADKASGNDICWFVAR